MKSDGHALARKELAAHFSASGGWAILLLWIVGNSCMLWIFSGDYNLLDSGSASLRPFFRLAPLLLMLLVPAVTMRAYAEERRSGTLELLQTHPLPPGRILAEKFRATCLFCGTRLSVGLYLLLYSLLQLFLLLLVSPRGVDVGETAGGYAGLLLLCLAFSSIGLFASACTRSSATAYLLGLALCFAAFYGCELVASLFSSGALHARWESVGMLARYEPMTRGMVTSDACVYFLSATALFLLLTLLRTARPDRKAKVRMGAAVAGLVVLNLLTTHFTLRLDLTADRRHTLSPTTRTLLESLQGPVGVTLYLDGDLNPQFYSLRSAVIDLLTEMANHAPEGIGLTLRNPNLEATDPQARAALLAGLERRGIKPLSVNERNRQSGQTVEQIIFPWAEVIYGGDTVAVPLLRNNVLQSATEVLHRSAAELEYGFSDALRILSIRQPERIAFIEGHGEMTEPALYQAYNALSRYYQVERGPIAGSADNLAPYKALVIAGPQMPFSEAEKFILDQYLMQGGSILLLTGGATFRTDRFEATGSSPTAKRDLNLDDWLFRYGLRIEPALLQDLQCTPIRLTSTVDRSTTTLPWYFSPLLLPSAHPITARIAPLKSEFVSPVTLLPADSGVKQSVLLTTSAESHTLQVPSEVSLRYVEMPATARYFDEGAQPAAVLVEGRLPSVWQHRPLPPGAGERREGRLDRTLPSTTSRLIVAASESLIRGEWEGSGRNVRPLPLGYEPASKTTLGNEDFLVQCLTYLTRQDQWLTLRSRTLTLRPIDPVARTGERRFRQALSLLLPLSLLLIHWAAFRLLRRRAVRRLGEKVSTL